MLKRVLIRFLKKNKEKRERILDEHAFDKQIERLLKMYEESTYNKCMRTRDKTRLERLVDLDIEYEHL